MGTDHGKGILIVEDDPKSLYALKCILTDRGYEVSAYASAEDVEVETLPVMHGAIIDVRLPDEQGPAFARRLFAAQRHYRIIFVTAYNSIAEIRESIPGAVVMVKPLDITTLANALK